MRATRKMTAVAMLGLPAGLGLIGATPALAAPADPSSLSVACDSSTNSIFSTTLYGDPGDTFTITNTVFGSYCYVRETNGNVGGNPLDGYTGIVIATAGENPSPGEIRIGPTAYFTIVGTGSFTMRYGPGASKSSTITVARRPAPPLSDAASSAPPIPEWVQAYGRHGADAACVDGWGTSWQSWAVPVTGGWVCTRSIPSLGG
jgi:hypothetical protein